MDRPFWQEKTLEELSPEEWEQLCDGCGKCCVTKLENEDTGELYWTTVGCRLLDGTSCQCSDYPNRKAYVPDCVKLTPAKVRSINWLPDTCAYKLVAEGKDLEWWHHLVSGDRELVHKTTISMRGRLTAFDDELKHPDDIVDHIIYGQP